MYFKAPKAKHNLPDAAELPEGTVWLHRGNGLTYILRNSAWVKESDADMGAGVDEEYKIIPSYISDYVEPSMSRSISPNQKRGRGRPKAAEKSRTRAPSDYNIFIKTEMLKGTFAHLQNGQERLTAISKLFKGKVVVAV